jgi:hypothetical protein
MAMEANPSGGRDALRSRQGTTALAQVLPEKAAFGRAVSVIHAGSAPGKCSCGMSFRENACRDQFQTEKR